MLADMCGVFVNHVFADLSQANALSVTLAALLFFVQIYCDFAGYSEIAMGSARLMGMSLSRNFNKPLLSASYTEFFRRWHITLNQWFTQYVYIPLGGNRKGKARKILKYFNRIYIVRSLARRELDLCLLGALRGDYGKFGERVITSDIRSFSKEKCEP